MFRQNACWEGRDFFNLYDRSQAVRVKRPAEGSSRDGRRKREEEIFFLDVRE